MSLRKKLNESPLAGIATSAGLFVVAGAVVWFTLVPRSSVVPLSGYYFFDLDAGELVVLPVETYPPALLENGHRCVEARIYACGECPESPGVSDIVFVRQLAESSYKKLMAMQDPERRAGFAAENAKWEIAYIEDAINGKWDDERNRGGDYIEKGSSICSDVRELKTCWPRVSG